MIENMGQTVKEANEQMKKAIWVLEFIKTQNPSLFKIALDAHEEKEDKDGRDISGV